MKLKRFLKSVISLFRPTYKLTAKVSLLQPNKRLVGKRIIITGGSRGLGFAMAKKFVAEGALVLVTGRDESQLKRAAETIGCLYYTYDVSDFDRMDDFIHEADAMLGGANVLVNNAGISLHEGNIRNVKESQYDSQFDINLKGAYFLTQKFLLKFEESKRSNGCILFVSSERGQHVDDLPYGIIKAAINSLTQGLSKMLIKNGIRVNAVAPGITATDMTGRSVDNLYAENYSTGRYYLPEEVAEIACFLVSDAAGCLSGQILVCNNGKSINYRM